MKRRDYYEVLGVEREADAAVLKRAYRELAYRYHPDQNPGDPDAEMRFKEVSEAYTVLSDPDKRARYDRRGFEGLGGEAGFGVDLGAFKALFDSLVGDLFGKKNKVQGRDLRYTLEVSFEEAALGAKKTIRFVAPGECTACHGTGGEGGEAGLEVCASCNGKGETKVQQGFFSLAKKCPACGGEGKKVKVACATCKGKGSLEREREFEVAIPAGTEDGSTRRVAGQGEPGRRGGTPGDLNVIVRVRPHELFRREGEVVVTEVPISFVQAALGATLEVPTLDGRVEMKVPPGTQSGTQFRLREKGMRLRSGARGDAHVRVIVETPVGLDEAQKALLGSLDAGLDAAQKPRQTAFQQRVAERKQ
jgi:molecular chaperone DnaJ